MLTDIAWLNSQLDLASVFSWASCNSDDLALLKRFQLWDEASILNHFVFVRYPNDALYHSRAVIHYNSKSHLVNWDANMRAVGSELLTYMHR